MLIKIKAFPGVSKAKIEKKDQDFLEVYVREKPIQGRANQAIVSALAKYFNCSESEIKLVKGFQERNKIFLIKKHDNQ